MKKFPLWLIIVYGLSLIPLIVYFNWYKPDNFENMLEAAIASPLMLLIFSLGSPILMVSVILMLIIHVYFLCKVVYGMFHKFNVKMSDRAKYVLPSMLGVSLITFMISMYQIKR